MGRSIEIDNVDFYLEDLKSKFKKIKPEAYYLSYSGGKDSHLLFWFLKIWLKENDFEMYKKYSSIPIIGINTYMEHPQILKRIKDNCDVVLKGRMKPLEIKEKYGIPCFSKFQDEMINRYQNGSRKPYLIRAVTGRDENDNNINTMFKLNNNAREKLLNGELHKISQKCCDKLKKKPARDYQKLTGKKEILGVMADEGVLRGSKYKSCFTEDKKFTPIWDLTDQIENAIYKKYNIELPEIYEHITRTGCFGCPYGSYKGNTEKELDLINENQRKFIVDYFKESYDLLGINYNNFLEKSTKKCNEEKKHKSRIEQLSLF